MDEKQLEISRKREESIKPLSTAFSNKLHSLSSLEVELLLRNMEETKLAFGEMLKKIVSVLRGEENQKKTLKDVKFGDDDRSTWV